MAKQHDPLMFLLALRHIEATSRTVRAAYERLESALSSAPPKGQRTVILDWIEAELMSLHLSGNSDNTTADLLLRSAVEFAKAARG